MVLVQFFSVNTPSTDSLGSNFAEMALELLYSSYGTLVDTHDAVGSFGRW